MEVLKAFDIMRTCFVTYQGRTRTFYSFYRKVIDDKYAVLLMDELHKLEDIELNGQRVAKRIGEQIVKLLAEMGLSEPMPPEYRMLRAYCIFWWVSYAKGYITELAIFQDLGKSSVQFHAHDLRNMEERFTPFDLIVLGLKGDVKSSTYFLHTMRSFPLRNSFYIAKLFDERRRARLRVVIMKEEAWYQINGPSIENTLERVAEIFPAVASIYVKGEKLIVVEYELWKQKVKAKQL